MPPRERQELIDFLRKNIDVFVWSSYDASKVDLNFICHCLKVNSSTISKKQPPRCSSREHSDDVKGEVLKLKRVEAIKEVFYPEWLANTMAVKKKTGKWLVCVDFTELNKAFLKDLFPLHQIGQLVDTTVDYPRMSF